VFGVLKMFHVHLVSMAGEMQIVNGILEKESILEKAHITLVFH
jgi:hypothetical protein